jgi:uncharacterized protein YkwD
MLLAAIDARGDQKSKQPAPPAKTSKAAEGAKSAQEPEKDVPAAEKAKPAADAKSKPSKPQPKQVELRPVEENIVKHTNSARAKFGLASLEIDHGLMESARQHAKWMARSQSLVHTSRPVAENIAMGQDTSKEAVGCWMNSSGHRANILSRGHRRIGVASARTANGTVFWCQQFR